MYMCINRVGIKVGRKNCCGYLGKYSNLYLDFEMR